MTFEERFSNLFRRGSARAQQAVQAAQGKAMPPAGGNRLTNFLPFPPGTDPSVNYTSPIQRGVYRLPQSVRAVFDNNSPMPTVSATPDRSRGVMVKPATNPIQPIARGSVTDATWQDRLRSRAVAASVRLRGMLGG